MTDAIVVVDREQGGSENTKKDGIRMHSLFSMSYLLNVLYKADRIEKNTLQTVSTYIEATQFGVGPFMNATIIKIPKLGPTSLMDTKPLWKIYSIFMVVMLSLFIFSGIYTEITGQ